MEVTPKAMIGDVPVYCAHDELVPIARVVPNPRNPNKHPESQLKLLSQVIAGNGWRQPITVSRRSGFVVKGHGRLMAAQVLGLDAVPVDFQDYETEAAEYADLVADNRLAELSEIDRSALKDILEELDTGDFDMVLTGFDDLALEDLMTAAPPPDADWADAIGGLPDGDKPPIQQKTFTLSDDQAATIEEAIQAAKDMGPFPETVNENANGNALARVAELFLSWRNDR